MDLFVAADQQDTFERKLVRLQQKVLNRNPNQTISNTILETVEKWLILLQKTSLPTNTSSSDPLVKEAIQAAYEAVQAGGTFARLAYIRWLDVLDSIESLITSERKRGQRKNDRNRNSTITIRIIIQTIPGLSKVQINNQLNRNAKRWKHLSGLSVFLLLLYSDKTESVMYVIDHFSSCGFMLTVDSKNYSSASNATVKMLAKRVMSTLPPALVETCQRLETRAKRYPARAGAEELKGLCDQLSAM